MTVVHQLHLALHQLQYKFLYDQHQQNNEQLVVYQVLNHGLKNDVYKREQAM